MDNLEKQWGTSYILSQALCIISNPSVNSNWSDSRETLNSGRIWYFVPCDLAIWWVTLKNNRAPLLYYIKLCASFQSHGWIQTGVTVRKHSIRVKIGIFCPIWPEIWRMTLKNNRRPFLSNIQLYASFHCHMWIQTGVTVRKRLSGVMTSVTLTFDHDIFASTSHLSLVITVNFRMIR